MNQRDQDISACDSVGFYGATFLNSHSPGPNFFAYVASKLHACYHNVGAREMTIVTFFSSETVHIQRSKRKLLNRISTSQCKAPANVCLSLCVSVSPSLSVSHPYLFLCPLSIPLLVSPSLSLSVSLSPTPSLSLCLPL